MHRASPLVLHSRKLKARRAEYPLTISDGKNVCVGGARSWSVQRIRSSPLSALAFPPSPFITLCSPLIASPRHLSIPHHLLSVTPLETLPLSPHQIALPPWHLLCLFFPLRSLHSSFHFSALSPPFQHHGELFFCVELAAISARASGQDLPSRSHLAISVII